MSTTNFYTCVLFSLLMLPFLVYPGIQNPYEFPKYSALLILMQVFLITRIFISYKTQTPLVHFDRTSLLVILFLACLFLADLFGLDPHTSLLGSQYRLQGFLLWVSLGILFLLFSALDTTVKKKLFTQFAKYAPFFLLLICSLALVDSIRFFLLHDYRVPTQSGRIVTTFGNPNFLAGYVVMLLPISLFGITLYKKLTHQTRFLVQIIVTMMAVGVIVLTDSKSALLALTMLLVIFLYTIRSRFVIPHIIVLLYKNRFLRKVFVLFSCVLTLIILLSFIDTLRFSPWDNRNIIWVYGIESVLKHPFLGIGQENYQLTFHDIRFYTVDSAHNIFLEIAVAAGIPALLVFCTFVFFVFKQSLYPIKLSVVAFFICAFFNPLSIPSLSLFWLLLSFSDKNQELRVKN